MIVFTCDTVQSFNEAMELRDIRLEVREDIAYRVERFRWKNEERINETMLLLNGKK